MWCPLQSIAIGIYVNLNKKTESNLRKFFKWCDDPGQSTTTADPRQTQRPQTSVWFGGTLPKVLTFATALALAEGSDTRKI